MKRKYTCLTFNELTADNFKALVSLPAVPGPRFVARSDEELVWKPCILPDSRFYLPRTLALNFVHCSTFEMIKYQGTDWAPIRALNVEKRPHRQRPAGLTSNQRMNVASFDPSFQDRVAAAAKAKQKALEQLRAKPAVDEALMAQRRQAREAREQIVAAERAAKQEAIATAKADKEAADAVALAEAEAGAALKAARLRPPSAAEMKAARDARYAARKSRKK